MFGHLFTTINEKVQLTQEEEQLCASFFVPRRLRKKQYLLQQDDVCKYTAFVEKGILRSYTSDDKGNEHIIQFAPEGWWISDIYSFLTGEPSQFNIDALEDCQLLLLTRDANEAMLQSMPKMERYFRILTQNALVTLQRRLVRTMTKTAEEKYLAMVQHYPDIIQRVPQHMIASYLGITPETVSRVRKQLSAKR